MTISQLGSDVRYTPRQALVGQYAYNGEGNFDRTLINKQGQVAQVSTITVDTATASYLYSFLINGVTTVSFTTPSSGNTTTTVAALIEAALEAEPLARGFFTVDYSAAIVTLTGIIPGLAFTVTETSAAAKTTIATGTAAASADAVAFGRGVITQGQSSSYLAELGALAKSSLLTAQVDTLAVTYAAGEIYSVGITIAEERYEVNVAADTDSATTGAAIVTAINAIMPAATVLAAGTASVTLTAEVLGQAFKTDVGLKTGTIARLALTHTVATAATDITKVLRGVTVYSADEEVTTIGGSTMQYPANTGMKVAERTSGIFVSSAEAISQGDRVYIELGSSNSGMFYKAGSATRVLLPRSMAVWERDGIDSSDSLAVLRLNCTP